MRTNSVPAVATWLAFAVALAMALPQPPAPLHLAAGVAVGAIVVFFGFFLSRRCRQSIARSHSQRAKFAALALLSGAALGSVLLFLLSLFVRIEPALRARFAARAGEPLWRPWALAFESSILEEVIFRLFAMTFIVWIASRFLRDQRTAFIAGLAGSALFFGAAHLPAWSSAAHAGALLFGCVLLLNGAGGVLFGWIYWRWGLPYAILSHFAGDVVIQTLGPRLLG